MPKRGYQPSREERLGWLSQLTKASVDAGLIDPADSDEDKISRIASVSFLPEARVGHILTALSIAEQKFDLALLADLVKIAFSIASIDRLSPTSQPAPERPTQDAVEVLQQHIRTINSRIDTLAEQFHADVARMTGRTDQQAREVQTVNSVLAELQSQIIELRGSQTEEQEVSADQAASQVATPQEVLVDFNEVSRQLNNASLSMIDEWSHLGWLRGTLGGSRERPQYMYYQSSIDEFKEKHMPEILNITQGRPPTAEGIEIKMRQSPNQQVAPEVPIPPATTSNQVRPVRGRRPRPTPEPEESTSKSGVEEGEKLLTQKQAAEFMGVSYQTPKNWSDYHGLPTVIREGRRLYRLSDLLAFERPKKGRRQ